MDIPDIALVSGDFKKMKVLVNVYTVVLNGGNL